MPTTPMHRTWSTENIVGMAQSGFARVRRMLRPTTGVGSEDATTDLQTLCRRVDERNKQHGAHGGGEVFGQCFEGFVSEVRLITESSQPGESCSPSSVDSPTDPVVSAADGSHRAKLKRSQENGLVMFFDVMCRIPALLFENLAARHMMDCGVLEVMMKVHDNACGSFSRRLVESSTGCLLHLLSNHPAMLTHVCEACHQIILRRTADTSTLCLHAQALLRTLMLMSETLRRGDMVAPELSNEAKATWQHLGTVDLLRDVVHISRQLSMRPDQVRNVPTLLSIGVVSLSVLGGLFRSNMPIKAALLDNAESVQTFIEDWAFFSSGVDRMQFTVAETHTNPTTGKPEELSLTVETPGMWGSELVGFVLELCTTGGCFSLQRQLITASTSPDDTDAHLEPHLPTASQTVSGQVVHPTRWEHLPSNWDTMLGSAVLMPWRIASSLSSCELTVSSARILLEGLARLDLVEPTAEFIYKACTASLLCLCRANPRNITVLHASGAVDTILAFMAPGSQVFPFAPNSVMPMQNEGAQDVWSISAALLTTILSFIMGPKELGMLMGAVDNMVHTPPSRDDCDAVETCLAVLASSIYAGDFYWFNGSPSPKATAPLEKIGGRWYGYSFAAWISSTCVWPDGGMIFSIRDPHLSSALALCIVSNGRTKCLAVRTATSKDQFSLVQIPEAVIGDKWHHIAVVHNIGGFNVYVDGRKCGVPSVNYPKEPAKPFRLTYTVGTGDRDLQVPPFFGMMANPQLIDGVLSEAAIERIVSTGIGAGIVHTETEKDLAHFSQRNGVVQLSGCLIKDEFIEAVGVTHHIFPNIVASLREVSPFAWIKRLIKNLRQSAHRSSVAILSLELIAGTLQQLGTTQSTEWMEGDCLSHIAAELILWESTQPEVLSAFFAVVMSDTASRKFREHPTTADTLRLLLDLIIRTTPESRSAALREVSEYLDEPSNAAYFVQHVGVNYLLDVACGLEASSVTEFVHAVEKVVRQPAELDLVFQFVTGTATEQLITARKGKSSIAVAVKCELLRMIYEVSKARPALCELLEKVNGVNYCLALLKCDSNDAELIRVIALRLLALQLHCSKKQRETFLRNNHFDTISAAISLTSASTRIGLPTFNALFKFALDFYRPSANDDAAVLSRIRESPSKAAKKAHVDPTATPSFNGHTPSMAQMRPLMCRAHSITSIGSSDMSDVDPRLSMDDTGDGSNRDTVVYPHCIATVLRLLQPVASAAVGAPLTANGTGEEGDTAGIGSDVPSATDPTEKVVILTRVLKYLSRMVELQHNAFTLAAQPWMEWMAPIVLLLTPTDGAGPSAAGPVVESHIRAIVRSIAVADMSRARGVRTAISVRRVREMPEAPGLQRLIFEEVVRYFGSHHRLETMDQEDATAVIRNIAEGVFTGVEDNIHPFPLALGLEMVKAVETIAVNNTSWVRQKMKAFRVFELRDKLAMFLLSASKNLAAEPPEAIEMLRIATQHDVNASSIVLRHLCDAAKDRDIDRFEAIQNIVRAYYVADEDQRKAMIKTVGDAEILDRLVNERTVIDNVQVKSGSVLLWIRDHEAQWDAMAQRVARAAKAVEGDNAAKTDKREKEQQSRIRSRKQEFDKKAVATAKQWSEFEKSMDELVAKSSSATLQAVSSVDKDRRARLDKYEALRTAQGGTGRR